MRAKSYLTLLGLILLIAGTAVSQLTTDSKESRNSFAATTTIPATAAATLPQGHEQLSDEASSDIKVTLLTLRPEGFEPAEIRYPPVNIFSWSVIAVAWTTSTCVSIAKQVNA